MRTIPTEAAKPRNAALMRGRGENPAEDKEGGVRKGAEEDS